MSVDPMQYVDQGPRTDDGDSPWAGCWSINHFYYGSSQDGVVRALRKGGTWEDVPGVARWACELISRDEAKARAIWHERDAISEVVMRHGGHARVRIEFLSDTEMRVAEYDWARWEEVVPRIGVHTS